MTLILYVYPYMHILERKYAHGNSAQKRGNTLPKYLCPALLEFG